MRLNETADSHEWLWDVIFITKTIVNVPPFALAWGIIAVTILVQIDEQSFAVDSSSVPNYVTCFFCEQHIKNI